jgi:phage shock protein C
MELPGTSPEQSSMGLLLSNRYRVIAGVCGGIAEWLGWSPTLVRVLYVLLALASAAFPGILVYIVLWILMPRAAR